MLKKTISVFLAAILIVALAGVPAFAMRADASPVSVSADNTALHKLVDSAVARLVGTKGRVYVSDELFSDIVSKIGSRPSYFSVKRAVGQYAVINTLDIPESARHIADSAKFTIVNGNEVYIAVNVEENPDLLDALAICYASAALVEKQDKFVAESGREDLIVNDYKGLSGELALHCAVYSITKAAGGAAEDSPLHGYYESARVADLNRSETRGAGLIRLLGEFFALLLKLFG